jgi:hypothetical protein
MARTGRDAPQVERLASFRAGLYASMPRRSDALFELSDTLVSGGGGPTLPPPHLSLQAVFRRGHGSVYGALRHGVIDAKALLTLLVAHRPADWPQVFAVDTSSWARDDAETSPDRGYYHHPSRHSNGKPIVAGWNYSFVAQVNFDKDSWTAPVAVARIHPREDTGRATARQVQEVVARLGETAAVPLFVFDAGYDPIGLTVDLADVRAEVLVRIRSDRVFCADPQARDPHSPGRPRRHGREFRLSSPPPPEESFTTTDPSYGKVSVDTWHGLHPRLTRKHRWKEAEEPPIVKGSVVRVVVEHLPKPLGNGRVLKTLWLWWAGAGRPDLSLCWRAYVHRFDFEHTLRFAKNTLGWTTPRVRLPEQADRWTLLVVSALCQLRLARGVVADSRLPWEAPRAQDKLTPTRVRRGFCQLLLRLGTPASPPKPTKAGPGRPKGSRRGPATRYPAIKKGP